MPVQGFRLLSSATALVLAQVRRLCTGFIRSFHLCPVKSQVLSPATRVGLHPARVKIYSTPLCHLFILIQLIMQPVSRNYSVV